LPLSEHLTIINALVGDRNGASESVYVTSRADNAAASKEQATKNVGVSQGDYEQPVHTTPCFQHDARIFVICTPNIQTIVEYPQTVGTQLSN